MSQAGHGHSHGHSHAHGGTVTGTHRRALATVMAISTTIAAAEVVGAIITGSLVLLADAAHMAADAAGVGLSLLAAWFAIRRLSSPPGISSGLLIAFGAGALLANVCSLLVLRRGQSESLNVRSAFLE